LDIQTTNNVLEISYGLGIAIREVIKKVNGLILVLTKLLNKVEGEPVKI
jgi:hypothetical protein